jgi:hypothetical protein
LNLWFLDASILLASEDPDDENHEDSRRLLVGSDPLATLDLAFYPTAPECPVRKGGPRGDSIRTVADASCSISRCTSSLGADPNEFVFHDASSRFRVSGSVGLRTQAATVTASNCG